MNKQSFFRANGVGLVLATGAFMLLGCDNSGRGLLHLDARPSAQWTCDKQFIPILNTLTSGFSTEEFRMVDNVSDWCRIWDTLYASYSPAPPCDTTLVDFAREVALLAAMGSRSSGGYTVQINCVQSEDTPGDIQVLVTESSPGPNCIVTAAFTSPATVVKVQRPVHTALFQRDTLVKDCTP